MAKDLATYIPALKFKSAQLRLRDLEGSGLFTFGNIFYVSSVTGSSANPGTSVEKPMATVDQAISLAAVTANNDDVIVILPGHTETVTSTSIALDVAGLRIIGMGKGLKRPTFTFSTAAATITVSAANCSWENCHFVGNFDNVAAAFTLGAAKDFSLLNNTFDDNSAVLHFLSILVTGTTDNGADGLTIVGNRWQGLALAPNAFISILAAEKRVLISDNDVFMDATNDVGHFLTLSSKIMTGIRLLRNTLQVVGATNASVGIFMTGSGTTSTGLMAYNLVSSLDTTTELIITAGTGITQFENYYTGTADASGKLWPVVDGA